MLLLLNSSTEPNIAQFYFIFLMPKHSNVTGERTWISIQDRNALKDLSWLFFNQENEITIAVRELAS